MQDMVRFCVLCRIKPHVPPRVQTSANSFEFQSCDRSTQAERLRVSLKKSYNHLILTFIVEGVDYQGI